MDSNDFKAMEKTELVKKVKQLKEELFHFRCQLAMGRIENSMRIRETKRNVARAKTFLRQREQESL